MNSAIIDKVNQIINDIDNNNEIKRFKDLKKQVEDCKEIQQLLLKLTTFNTHSQEYIKIKDELYNHPLYKDYHLLEINLHYIILHFNSKLNNIISYKQCQNPTGSRI